MPLSLSNVKTPKRWSLFSTESSGEEGFTWFSHKAAFTLGTGSPGRTPLPERLPLELSGLPAAVQTQLYFGNWLLDGGVGCQHLPQAGWCHTSFWHEKEGILVLHQFPGLHCQLREINGPFSIMLYLYDIYQDEKRRRTPQAPFLSVVSKQENNYLTLHQVIC